MTKYLYRVLPLSKFAEKIEQDINMPGCNFCITGFYYRKKENAFYLWEAKNEHMQYSLATQADGTWADIIRIERRFCTMEENFQKYKSGHDDKLDQNECFVSSVNKDATVEVWNFSSSQWEEISIDVFNKEV